jgi:hypothetical protein
MSVQVSPSSSDADEEDGLKYSTPLRNQMERGHDDEPQRKKLKLAPGAPPPLGSAMPIPTAAGMSPPWNYTMPSTFSNTQQVSPGFAAYAMAEMTAQRVANGPTKRPPQVAREVRLEQNRRAATESRRRRKVMIEDLERSVFFFSQVNASLKQRNEELTRLLTEAQAQVAAAMEGGGSNKEEVVKNNGMPKLDENAFEPAQDQSQESGSQATIILLNQGVSPDSPGAHTNSVHTTVAPASQLIASIPNVPPGATLQTTQVAAQDTQKSLTGGVHHDNNDDIMSSCADAPMIGTMLQQDAGNQLPGMSTCPRTEMGSQYSLEVTTLQQTEDFNQVPKSQVLQGTPAAEDQQQPQPQTATTGKQATPSYSPDEAV